MDNFYYISKNLYSSSRELNPSAKYAIWAIYWRPFEVKPFFICITLKILLTDLILIFKISKYSDSKFKFTHSFLINGK